MTIPYYEAKFGLSSSDVNHPLDLYREWSPFTPPMLYEGQTKERKWNHKRCENLYNIVHQPSIVYPPLSSLNPHARHTHHNVVNIAPKVIDSKKHLQFAICSSLKLSSNERLHWTFLAVLIPGPKYEEWEAHMLVTPTVDQGIALSSHSNMEIMGV